MKTNRFFFGGKSSQHNNTLTSFSCSFRYGSGTTNMMKRGLNISLHNYALQRQFKPRSAQNLLIVLEEKPFASPQVM